MWFQKICKKQILNKLQKYVTFLWLNVSFVHFFIAKVYSSDVGRHPLIFTFVWQVIIHSSHVVQNYTSHDIEVQLLQNPAVTQVTSPALQVRLLRDLSLFLHKFVYLSYCSNFQG